MTYVLWMHLHIFYHQNVLAPRFLILCNVIRKYVRFLILCNVIRKYVRLLVDLNSESRNLTEKGGSWKTPQLNCIHSTAQIKIKKRIQNLYLVGKMSKRAKWFLKMPQPNCIHSIAQYHQGRQWKSQEQSKVTPFSKRNFA